MTEGLLEKARQDFLAEGWTPAQVEAALTYAQKWASGNADTGAAGDRKLRELLVQNYLPRGIQQAHEWLTNSRAKWAAGA